jgi:KaiC/GvpD/RAD55 family RecA-like ATPase
VNTFQTYQNFLRALYTPSDVVAFAFINHKGGVEHAFIPRTEAETEKYFDTLTKLNQAYSIFVGMNPFKPELVGKTIGRTKDNVAAVKRLYVDADHIGEEGVQQILSSGKVPSPTVVLESSPTKFQLIWNVSGLTKETAESLLKTMAEEFQTDKAVSEISRVLRVPGFKNRKYVDAPEVKAVSINPEASYDKSAFKLDVKSEGQTFESKPDGWINEPIVHGNINNRLTQIAGYYIGEKFVKDAAVLFELLKGHAERQAVCKDGQTPFQCNTDEIKKIADGCVSRYKTKKLELTQPQATDVAQPATALAMVDVSNWRDLFRSVGEMEDGPIDMIIEGVLQEGTCFIGANPGDGKTLVALAYAKAICTGTPLFGIPQFFVKQPRTVVYLIPESRDRSFRKRCEAFRLPDDKMKFMARTISAGMSLELSDPRLLEAVRQTKAVVFLDTASRFMKGSDENAAAQNRQLVNDVIALLAAGAVCVILVHHATKAAKTNQERMTLENMLRGTSDFGAMCDQAYGIRKDMILYANGNGPMEIELVSLKDREQIGGLTSIRLAASHKTKEKDERFPVSYITKEGNFRVVSDSETSHREVQALESSVKNEPNIPAKELAVRFNMTEYRVKTQLAKLGWHRVQGGPGGASPWHQDLGSLCPYEKVVEMKPKTTVEDAVAYLQKALAGTAPDGEYVSETDILTGADKAGISDALVGKARKRLGVVVGKEGNTVAWSLPQPEEQKAG